MEELAKLFGSAARVKVMRLFMLNPMAVFAPSDIAKKTKVKSPAVRSELNTLKTIGFLKKRAAGYQLEGTYDLLNPLKALLVNSESLRRGSLLRRINKMGKIKLLVVAGVFIHDDTSRADLLVVGDNLKRGALESYIKDLEAEIGRELNYALMDAKEFDYRIHAYDRFIRDILDYPHQKLVNKLGL